MDTEVIQRIASIIALKEAQLEQIRLALKS